MRGGKADQSRRVDWWTAVALGCLAVGALLLIVGWYDVSGTVEVADQLSYLASSCLFGLALVIVGTGLLVAGRADRAQRHLGELVQAATQPVGELSDAPASAGQPTDTPATPSREGDELVVVVGDTATTAHRPECPLVRGKPTTPLSAEEARRRGLRCCPVCG